MILYSNSSQNKLDKYPNTHFRPEETGSIFLERHSYPTFATLFCNDAVCPVFSYFQASQLFRLISLLQNTVVEDLSC